VQPPADLHSIVVGEWSEGLQHDQADGWSVQKGECPDSEATGQSEAIPEPSDSQQLLRRFRRRLHFEWLEHLRPRMEIMEKRCVVIDKLAHDESGGRGDCLTHASIVPSPVAPVGVTRTPVVQAFA